MKVATALWTLHLLLTYKQLIDKLYSPRMVVTIYKYTIGNNLTK